MTRTPAVRATLLAILAATALACQSNNKQECEAVEAICQHFKETNVDLEKLALRNGDAQQPFEPSMSEDLRVSILRFDTGELDGGRAVHFLNADAAYWVKDGQVYVVDSRFENIQIFTRQGELLLTIGGEGTGPGKFWLPVGIFADANDNIWVGDSHNHRVQVFRYLRQTDPEVEP